MISSQPMQSPTNRFVSAPCEIGGADEPGACGADAGPQDACLLRVEAIAAFDRGNVREALRLWRQMLASSTRTKDALFQVACCHALLDEPAQACHAFLSVAGDVRVDTRLRRRAAELARLVDPIA